MKTALDISLKELSLEENYIVFNIVCRIEEILIEAWFAKCLNEIGGGKKSAFVDGLVFENCLRQMTINT